MTFTTSTQNFSAHDESLACRYRGFMEHTHNFHLLYKYFGNRFMYVCSRCLGLYGGFIIWLLVFIVFPLVIRFINLLKIYELLLVCFILTIPLVLDWWIQCLAIHHSNNLIRLLTGLLTSLSGIIMVFSPKAYWISIPCGYLWMKLVKKIGKNWRRKRDPKWGCWACQGNIPKAHPIYKKGEEIFVKI